MGLYENNSIFFVTIFYYLRIINKYRIMEKYHKDPELAGIYVKRCKCGARPYYDRIAEHNPSFGCWISCNCGEVGESGSSKQKAIENWNAGIMDISRF